MAKSNQLPVDIYVRVSRVGGREHMISPEEQERDARAFAERRGLRVGQVLTDLDRSGGTLKRPELQKALARVRERKSGGIVVAYLSRLTRETSQGLTLIDDVRAAGGEVYAPNLSDHTTADGRMLNTIQLAIDAGMRERAKETIARARENAIANGIPVTNRDAVGYRRNAERRYEPDADVAPIIRDVFVRRAGGAGPTELAELLEANGVRTSQGSRTWSKPAVQNLIKSRTYLGELRSGPYVNPAAHEPLIDEPTWRAAQHPNPSRRRVRKGGYLLSGIVRCKACGYCMQGTFTSRGKRIYRCPRRHAGGICPAPARVDADLIERRVLDEIDGMSVPKVPTRGSSAPLNTLETAFQSAERLLEQALTPEAQEALGDVWAATVKGRREARDDAARALGEARATADRSKNFWDAFRQLDLTNATREELREAIAGVFRYIAVDRAKELHYPPDDYGTPTLSRRGFTREPGLNPL
jgi:DNA invertase Pin-like site-specific DNA recombinase